MRNIHLANIAKVKYPAALLRCNSDALSVCYGFLPDQIYGTHKEAYMKTEQKNTKKIVISLIALLSVAAVFFGIYRFTRQAATEGSKNITVEVIHRDTSLNTFTYSTDREYLGEVLKDEGLVSGEEGPYGMFIKSVDGETADESNQEWWCITKNNEKLGTSADQTPIADGEKYELTLTIGY